MAQNKLGITANPAFTYPLLINTHPAPIKVIIINISVKTLNIFSLFIVFPPQQN